MLPGEVQPLKGVQPNKVENAVPVFFFEKGNGEVIFTKEAEAWRIFSNKNQVLGSAKDRLKFVGKSSGIKYQVAVVEAQAMLNEKGLAVAQAHLKKAVDEEYEEAKLNKVPPRNFDTVGSNGAPIRLSDLR